MVHFRYVYTRVRTLVNVYTCWYLATMVPLVPWYHKWYVMPPTQWHCNCSGPHHSAYVERVAEANLEDDHQAASFATDPCHGLLCRRRWKRVTKSPGTQRYVDQGSGATPGLAVETYAAVKAAKYADQDNFIPFILETVVSTKRPARRSDGSRARRASAQPGRPPVEPAGADDH
jgi:hypothetical protein